MGLTRFKNRQADGVEIDGPVSGALQMVVVNFSPGVAGGTSDKYKIDLPAGCRFKVTDASFRASAIAGTPTLAIGTTANATALVASTNLSTNLGALTVKSASQHLAADSMLIATLTVNGGTNTCRGGVLTLVGHVSAPPTSVVVRNASHF